MKRSPGSEMSLFPPPTRTPLSLHDIELNVRPQKQSSTGLFCISLQVWLLRQQDPSPAASHVRIRTPLSHFLQCIPRNWQTQAYDLSPARRRLLKFLFYCSIYRHLSPRSFSPSSSVSSPLYLGMKIEILGCLQLGVWS